MDENQIIGGIYSQLWTHAISAFEREHPITQRIQPIANPPRAVEWAWRMVGHLEQANGCSISAMLRRAALADMPMLLGPKVSQKQLEARVRVWRAKFAFDFGKGVCALVLDDAERSWFVEHARFPLKTGPEMAGHGEALFQLREIIRDHVLLRAR